MELWRSDSDGRLAGAALVVLLALAVMAGCERDDTVAVDRNRPPETFVTQGPEISNDPNNPTDLYYRAHLFWRGEDYDGTVEGFYWAVADEIEDGFILDVEDLFDIHYTTRTDSVFRFRVADIGAREHFFWISAVDNQGKFDPTPDVLHFESYTTANPVVDLNSITVTAESPTLGHVTGLVSEDTVEVFSDVTVCWSGSDEDGFVVGWESKFDNETSWRLHEVADNCRSETSLRPGAHTFSLRAIDDAGAKSTDIRRVRIYSNFDPKTVLDLASVEALLPRPWLSATDTLRIGPGVAPGDTLPLGATVSLCWSSTDLDGPVVRYQWNLAGILGQTEATCINTDTTGVDPISGEIAPQRLPRSDAGNGLPFLVKGIDIYDNVEQRPDTLLLHVNFRPTVQFLEPPVRDVTAGTTALFCFQGDDEDSDPQLLTYQWLFSFQGTSRRDSTFTPGNLCIGHEFRTSEIGVHTLKIWAQDQSGPLRESAPDSIVVRVSAPAPGQENAALPARADDTDPRTGGAR